MGNSNSRDNRLNNNKVELLLLLVEMPLLLSCCNLQESYNSKPLGEGVLLPLLHSSNNLLKDTDNTNNNNNNRSNNNNLAHNMVEQEGLTKLLNNLRLLLHN